MVMRDKGQKQKADKKSGDLTSERMKFPRLPALMLLHQRIHLSSTSNLYPMPQTVLIYSPFSPHLASQLLYMGVDRAGVSEIIIVPHRIQNFFS